MGPPSLRVDRRGRNAPRGVGVGRPAGVNRATVRAPRGRLILPNRELKRFHLPDVPTDAAPAVVVRVPGAGRALLAAAWLVFCTVCFFAAEGMTNPATALTERLPRWWERLSGASKGDRPVSAPAPAPSPAPKQQAVPARRVSLPPLPRHRPDAHGGGPAGFSAAGGLVSGRQERESSALGASALELEPAAPTDEPTTTGPRARAPSKAPPRAAGEPLRASGVGALSPRPAPVFSVVPTDLDELDEPSSAASEPVARSAPGATDPATSRRSPDEAVPDATSAPAPSQRTWTATRGMGCEEAHASFERTIDVSATPGADVPREAYARMLEDFANYRSCDLNHEMDVSICVAVVNGRARGITVKTQPANARLATCIASAVSRLHYPKSPNMDLVRTELIVR